MLEIAKKKEDLTFESAIEQNLAVVYEIIGNIPQVLERYFNSLEIAESQADTMAMIAVFNNIGDLYGQMEEYQRAEQYIYQSLELARKLNSKSDIYNAYTNPNVQTATEEYKAFESSKWANLVRKYLWKRINFLYRTRECESNKPGRG